MGDESTEHNPRIGPSTLIDGPEEMRRAVRLHCREGVYNIKLDVSGDPFYAARAGTLARPRPAQLYRLTAADRASATLAGPHGRPAS